jgi:hypothetical protein
MRSLTRRAQSFFQKVKFNSAHLHKRSWQRIFVIVILIFDRGLNKKELHLVLSFATISGRTTESFHFEEIRLFEHLALTDPPFRREVQTLQPSE